MAKGYKAPKGQGGMGMMNQLQKLQEQLAQAQAQLAEETVTATAGGGGAGGVAPGGQAGDVGVEQDMPGVDGADRGGGAARPRASWCRV